MMFYSKSNHHSVQASRGRFFMCIFHHRKIVIEIEISEVIVQYITQDCLNVDIRYGAV